MIRAADALAGLWSLGGLDPAAIDEIELSGPEELLPSVLRVGAVAVASTAAATLAARELLRLKGPVGAVSVDGRHASLAFRSERYLTVDGQPPPSPWSPLSGYYQTLDGGWIQLHCNFEHHVAGVLAELSCPADRPTVEAAILERDRFDLEDALAARAMCATAFRSPTEWAEHPQSLAVRALPVLEIVQIGEALPQPLPAGTDRALSAIRVVDQTRVIAGPVCARFLAAHGATVMRVGAAHLPVIDSILADTGMGKLAVNLDLRLADEKRQFMDLVSGADVVVQGYRPDGLSSLGLGPNDLAEHRPGIVYASLSAYGHLGPWASRRGFDSLVQTASGICWAGMEAAGIGRPKPLPAQALDHASGYLLAYGALVALHHRATIGGSWLVRTSLAQVANWLTGLGLHDGLGIEEPARPDDLRVFCDGALGNVGVIGPVGFLEGAEARWERCAPVLGSSPPEWPGQNA